MTRRGLAPGVMHTLLPSDAVSTNLPAVLEEATVHASTKVLPGHKPLAGAVSVEAIALMEGTLRSMMTARWIVGVASLVFAGFITLVPV